FFFSSRRRHTSFSRDWSSDVCSSDLDLLGAQLGVAGVDLVLLDVDRGQEVIFHEAVADDDGVFVVVACQGMKATSRLRPRASSPVGRGAGRGRGGEAGGGGGGGQEDG